MWRNYQNYSQEHINGSFRVSQKNTKSTAGLTCQLRSDFMIHQQQYPLWEIFRAKTTADQNKKYLAFVIKRLDEK